MIAPNISLPPHQPPLQKKKLDMVFDFAIILCLTQDLEIWMNNLCRRTYIEKLC